MQTRANSETSWQGKVLKVQIPFTRAGVAQVVIVSSDKSAVLIDTGDGILRDLLALGLSVNDIDALFYTHGHFDHMGGLHSLLGFMRMKGRRAPLYCYCPSGCVEVIGALANFRKCYEGSIPFELRLNEITGEDDVHLSNISVHPYDMVHCGSIEAAEVLDPIPALGYRIACEGEAVAVTGDCGRASPLAELVKDVDLAIIEGTYPTSAGKHKEALDKVHLSEEMACELGKLAREFVIVHRVRRT